MSDYIPTTADVKEVWCTPLTVGAAIDEEAHWEAEDQFDRWLAQVKAEAWDEGCRAEHVNCRRLDEGTYELVDNPYMKGAGNDS